MKMILLLALALSACTFSDVDLKNDESSASSSQVHASSASAEMRDFSFVSFFDGKAEIPLPKSDTVLNDKSYSSYPNFIHSIPIYDHQNHVDRLAVKFIQPQNMAGEGFGSTSEFFDYLKNCNDPIATEILRAPTVLVKKDSIIVYSISMPGWPKKCLEPQQSVRAYEHYLVEINNEIYLAILGPLLATNGEDLMEKIMINIRLTSN